MQPRLTTPTTPYTREDFWIRCRWCIERHVIKLYSYAICIYHNIHHRGWTKSNNLHVIKMINTKLIINFPIVKTLPSTVSVFGYACVHIQTPTAISYDTWYLEYSSINKSTMHFNSVLIFELKKKSFTCNSLNTVTHTLSSSIAYICLRGCKGCSLN